MAGIHFPGPRIALDGDVAGVIAVDGKHVLLEQVLLDRRGIPPPFRRKARILWPPTGLFLDAVERFDHPRIGTGCHQDDGVRS